MALVDFSESDLAVMKQLVEDYRRRSRKGLGGPAKDRSYDDTESHQAPEVYVAKPQGAGGIPGRSTDTCSAADCCWEDVNHLSIGGASAIAVGTANARHSYVSMDWVYDWLYELYWDGTNWVIEQDGVLVFIGPTGECPYGEYVDYQGTGTGSGESDDTVCVASYCAEDGGDCTSGEVLDCVFVDGATAEKGDDVNGEPSYVGTGFTVSWNGAAWELTVGSATYAGGTDSSCPFGAYGDVLTGTGTPEADEICVHRYQDASGRPGIAECDIFKISQDGCGGGLVDAGFDKWVYNLGDDAQPQDYLLALRDKFGNWIATSAAGTPTVQIIQFRVLAAGPFEYGDLAECENAIRVTATVVEVTCAGSDVAVGDTVRIWDPRHCYFDIPIEVLYGAVGTAVRVANQTISSDCAEYDDIVAEGGCRWVCTGLSCCEEIYGCTEA